MEVNNLNGKNDTKKKLIIYACIIIIIGIISIGIIILFKHTDKSPEKNLIYHEFEPLISKIDDETYYIFGAKKDISFEITPNDNFSYKLIDEDGNELLIDVVNNVIKAPNDGYKDGTRYELTITNATFKDEKIKNAKKIIFNTIRPTIGGYTFSDNVKTQNDNNYKIENDILTTSNKYELNDIVAIIKDNKVYKITKVNNDNTYQVTIPKIEEVFKDIDYYGMEKVNLSSFVIDDKLKMYMMNIVKNSLIKTVYAKENVEIKEAVWDDSNQTLNLTINITSNEKTNIFTSSLNSHKLIAEMNITISANIYKDITIKHSEYALELNYEYNYKFNLKNNSDKINNLNNNFTNNIHENDLTWLLNDYSKIANDKLSNNINLGKTIVNTEVIGTNIELDLGLILDIDAKTIMNSSLSGNLNVTTGFNNLDNYQNYIVVNSGEFSSIGNNNNRVGYYSNIVLTSLDKTDINSSINTLMYMDSTETINSKDNNKEAEYEVNGENGNYLKITINDKNIIDKKLSVKTYNKKYTLVDNKKEEKKEEKPIESPEEKPPIVYKYTKEEIKRKLQTAYDELASLDTWTMRGGTFLIDFKSNKIIDVENNIFSAIYTYDGSVSYNCDYDYINKSMKCTNYNETKSYIKNICDEAYNDYQNFLVTGEIENEDNEEWENIYDSMDACYYEIIPSTEPLNFDEDFNKILTKANLTIQDLDVLKS